MSTETNKLPEVLRERYLPNAERTAFFGMMVSELSRDDLIVMALMGWEEAQRERDRASGLERDGVDAMLYRFHKG